MALHPAPARGEVYERGGGRRFPAQRRIGERRELEPRLGKQERPHRGRDAQQLVDGGGVDG